MNDQPTESNKTSRRHFLRNTSLAAAGAIIVPRHVLGRGFVAPSDRLVVASVGAGGKGEGDIANFFASGKADIAYLCDVDDRRSANSRKKFPKAKYYKDWRELLDKEHKNFDAVSVYQYQRPTTITPSLPFLPCSWGSTYTFRSP
jgi:hypothetical protein